MSDSLRPHGLEPTRFLCPWDFLGSSIGVNCHVLLQGIFPTQGLNLGLPHCRQTLYHLSHQGSTELPLKNYSPFCICLCISHVFFSLAINLFKKNGKKSNVYHICRKHTLLMFQGKWYLYTKTFPVFQVLWSSCNASLHVLYLEWPS